MFMKQCPKCGKFKEFSEYHKNKYKKDGVNHSCKECVKGYDKNRYWNYSKKEREHIRKYQRERWVLIKDRKNKLRNERYAKDKEYREKLKEDKRISYKENKHKHLKLKKEVFDKYGGNRCSCCGESTFEFLSIDHINGGGHKHRKTNKIRNIYKWLKDNNYPEGYRVLCFNCNCSMGFYGYCPHEREKNGIMDKS